MLQCLLLDISSVDILRVAELQDADLFMRGASIQSIAHPQGQTDQVRRALYYLMTKHLLCPKRIAWRLSGYELKSVRGRSHQYVDV